MSGVIKPDSGSITVDGQVLTPRTPLDARRAGIAMIHQELQQVPELTVAQNMFLGRSLIWSGLFVDRARQQREAASALAKLDPAIPPDAPIKSLKVAQRQIVEIARALLENAKIIAMDEPTSSLTPSEFERLAEVIAQLASTGVSIIYVSHKMDEVFKVCGRATVMRDGQLVGEVDLRETTEAAVVSMMVGRTLAVAEHRSSATAETTLAVHNLTSGSKGMDASFDLKRGEVLGIAGLIGAGRTELLRLLAGADKPTSGFIELNGRRVDTRNPRAAIIPRGIAAGSQILLFDEPTRGIDIGAKAEIYGLIEKLAAEGKSIIVVSSELPEIIRLADRVLVMRQGRIAAGDRRACRTSIQQTRLRPSTLENEGTISCQPSTTAPETSLRSRLLCA